MLAPMVLDGLGGIRSRGFRFGGTFPAVFALDDLHPPPRPEALPLLVLGLGSFRVRQRLVPSRRTAFPPLEAVGFADVLPDVVLQARRGGSDHGLRHAGLEIAGDASVDVVPDAGHPPSAPSVAHGEGHDEDVAVPARLVQMQRRFDRFKRATGIRDIYTGFRVARTLAP